MKILDQSNQEILPSEVDFEKGYLTSETIFVKHHDEVLHKEPETHYEMQTFYFTDNTSLDVSYLGNDDPHVKVIDAKEGLFEYVDQGEGKTYMGGNLTSVIDVPGVEGHEAWDEYEEIQRYNPYTPEELKNIQEQIAQQEKEANFMTKGPDLLTTTVQATAENSTSIEDINLLIADLIGA